MGSPMRLRLRLRRPQKAAPRRPAFAPATAAATRFSRRGIERPSGTDGHQRLILSGRWYSYIRILQQNALDPQ